MPSFDPKAVAVVGAGSWGTAIADLLGTKGLQVTLWAFEPEVADAINRSRENSVYLKSMKLSENITATSVLEECVRNQDVVVSVSPSQVVRAVMKQAAAFMKKDCLVVNASKGIENETLSTMSDVFEEVLDPSHKKAFMSGPSFAVEVASKQPTVVSVAAVEEKTAQRAQALFSAPYFRVYTSTDVVGLELGGSLKNVIAIAAGISDGLGYGHNARAALITRGLAEISRLGLAMGASPISFSGLAGMGDLVLTCTGDLSRNRTVGIQIGQGKKLDEILREMKAVAEGVRTAKSAYELSLKQKVEMPITEQVYQILFENKDPKAAVLDLMSRSSKTEHWWIEPV